MSCSSVEARMATSKDIMKMEQKSIVVDVVFVVFVKLI